MITNIVLVIPTLALLIVVTAYLSARGIVVEALFIGLTSWPWAARAIRAQTFSLAAARVRGPRRASAASPARRVIFVRDRAQHELVPVPDVHPAVRRARS